MTYLQLPSEDAAEQWEVAMQGTRDLLEQKLRAERHAAALAAEAAQRDAASAASAASAAAEERAAAAAASATATAAIMLSRDRERAALQEAETATAEHRDIMSRVAAMQQQLRLLEQATYARVVQEQRLSMELEQVKQKTRVFLQLQQQQQQQQQPPTTQGASFVALTSPVAPPDAATLHLPHALTAQATAVLEEAGRALCDV